MGADLKGLTRSVSDPDSVRLFHLAALHSCGSLRPELAIIAFFLYSSTVDFQGWVRFPTGGIARDFVFRRFC